jgi:queuine tRNA-ribosyltransferase
MDGPLRFRNARFAQEDVPLETDCPCYTCRHFSRAYLHHLFQAREMLGPSLLSLHNIAFYCRLMAETRAAIERGTFAEYRAARLARWEGSS